MLREKILVFTSVALIVLGVAALAWGLKARNKANALNGSGLVLLGSANFIEEYFAVSTALSVVGIVLLIASIVLHARAKVSAVVSPGLVS